VASATVKLAAALAAAGLVGIGGWRWATHWRPSPDVYPLQGVDLPVDAPVIEWGSVRAAGADFAYLTATAGARTRAPAFEANWHAVPEAGLRRGAVHLLDPCLDGRAQADAFNAVVPRTADALPPAVAIEETGECDAAAADRELRRFVAAAEAHSRKPIVLRVSRGVQGRYRLATAIDRPLWVIGDFLRPGYGARPWRLWRASGLRRVDGVEQPMNWSVVAP
jgi:lysozyme